VWLSTFLLVVRHIVALHVSKNARNEADRLSVLVPPLHIELQKRVALVRRAVLEERGSARQQLQKQPIPDAVHRTYRINVSAIHKVVVLHLFVQVISLVAIG
jgi:hypothetical protein